jgi:hypothetical protein
MKKLLVLLLALLLLLSLFGCKKAPATPQGILVEGVFYVLPEGPSPGEVDESAVIGNVTAYTDAFPEQEGETNISETLIGAPYARVEGGIALLYQHEWYLCTAETAA